jgi:hypothetical protein
MQFKTKKVQKNTIFYREQVVVFYTVRSTNKFCTNFVNVLPFIEAFLLLLQYKPNKREI